MSSPRTPPRSSTSPVKTSSPSTTGSRGPTIRTGWTGACIGANDEVAATVADEGDKGGGADGLESDAANNLYVTNYEHHAILHRSPAGLYTTLVHDPRLMWPDTLCVAPDGYLYVTANGYDGQTRFHAGRDVRLKPYSLFRLRIDARPVRLA